jgi:hypothetical protein
MRKGLWVIATTIAAGGAIAGPAWAGKSPTATTAPPPPHAGAYVGRTSQGLRFSVSVAQSRTQLSTANFGFRVRCADHRMLQFSVSPIVNADPWGLNSSGGTGFTRAFHDTSGEHYWIHGRFTGSGTVSGTLSTSWHSPHNGVCRSGRLDWHASLGH